MRIMYRTSMKEDENLEIIKRLLASVASKTAPFQTSCSETKILAYTNRDAAVDRYRDIAKQALNSSEGPLHSQPDCKRKLSRVQHILEQESLNQNILEALTALRSTYLKKILRPAVKGYLMQDERKSSEIEKLYEKIFTLDGLIEVAQFFDRVDSF